MMKRLLFVLLLIAVISGCSMKEYCAERFPAVAYVKDSVNVINTITYRDTLIFVPVPYESKTDTIFVDASNSAYSTLTTAFAWSYAYFADGKLIHFLQQKDSLIELNLKNAIKEHSTVEYREIEKQVLVETNKMTAWQTFQMTAAWVLAVVILIGSLWKKLPTAIVGKLMAAFKKRKPP